MPRAKKRDPRQLVISYTSSRIYLVKTVNNVEEWLKTGKWVLVDSTNVAAVRYDIHKKILQVLFLSGWQYTYVAIGYDLAVQMFNSSSLGTFVHYRLVRGGYDFTKVRVF